MPDVHDTGAVRRDEDDPFSPRGDDGRGRRSHAMFDWANVSHALMPTSLRDRAVAVGVETNKRRYALEEPVHFRVTLANRLPFPVALATTSPVLWSWSVDGVERATTRPESVPEERGLLRFGRSERKLFERRWSQRIRDEGGRWVPVQAGEYELAAWINVDDPDGRGLAASTSVVVEH